MSELTTEPLGRACRLFLEIAFANNLEAISSNKRVYLELAAGLAIADYLPPASAAVGIVQNLATRVDGQLGYELRLGCSHYRNLKLRVQTMEFHGERLWVYSVDTHDAFSSAIAVPPVDHPDAAEWIVLQRKNAVLKKEIEETFEQAGLPTFKSLLRRDLE